MSQEPRVKIEDVASDYHDFYSKLVRGQLPMPLWLSVGDDGFRITAENYKLLSAGITLGSQARAHFGG